ncbi:hypothetical protein ASF21_12960 [Arthrobacter sp. Leaf234]|uniref:acyltransferase n=1 Tax=Arthrobacter sp. Leaf234 TaxID=1736303 RepID=UPI0006FAADA3|nr:acyltransferase [Arthrobacter sp. Leaf234]KQN99712.1 hypothetical protein ASF21_12960 [Arthrobacter sp. Leaf234]
MNEITPVLLRGADIKPYSDDNGNVIEGTPRTNGYSIVEFRGSNCKLVFGENVRMYGQIAFQRDDSIASLADKGFYRGRTSLGLGCSVSFGYNIYCGIDLQVNTAEGQSITIGDDILIANHVRIKGDDSHPIYDGVTGQRINPSRPVVIEDHVWIGQETFIMPGSHIGTGSIIGARSMVMRGGPIPPHSLAAGSPATVRRSNVHWVRKHTQNSFDLTEEIEPMLSPEEPAPVPRGSKLLTCDSCSFQAHARDEGDIVAAAAGHEFDEPKHTVTVSN